MSSDSRSAAVSGPSASMLSTSWELPKCPARGGKRPISGRLGFASWRGRLLWLLLLLLPAWLLDRPFAMLSMLSKNLVLADIRDATRQFGEPAGIAWISIVIWSLDRSRRRPLVVALVAGMIASGVGSGTKLLVGRERPKVTNGETMLSGPHWPGSMKPDSSFPSGHTTIAFAFAYGLCRLYPSHGWLWVGLAGACGLSRALSEAHFLTDVLVGAWLGWELARLTWSGFPGHWLMRRLDNRFTARPEFPQWNWKTNPEFAA